MSKETCNLCSGLLDDIDRENPKYKRDFEQITKNLDCKDNFVCLPLLRLKEKNDKREV